MEDIIVVTSISEVESEIIQPLVRRLGQWRFQAGNSSIKKNRERAIEDFPVLLSEISRYKSSLEEFLTHVADLESREFVTNILIQIDYQIDKVKAMLDDIVP